MSKRTSRVLVCLLAATLLGVAYASAEEKINTDPDQQLPDPDTRPPAAGKPIKVFILSNRTRSLTVTAPISVRKR